LNVYDAQGFATPVKLYFEKQTAANTWNVYGGIDVPAVAGPPAVAAVTYPSLGTLVFSAAGKLTSATPASTVVQANTNNVLTPAIDIPANSIDSDNPNLTGKLPQVLTLDLSGAVSQFGSAFAVANLRQDGYTTGELTSLNIGENGNITARYSNGQTQSSGKIVLAEFRNVQGLTPIGGGNWMSTHESGQPIQGSPGTGKFGALRAGAVEESNVDLTAELVNMMTAQRAYQANAQTIKTQDQVMSTLVNLR
jgi:flagellar hook protein FlgE